ncbi:PASTA domain-containing protein [Actinoplanes utahensis]|uniref:PASTA domain-containing protein n=1 Tax=Actinoplanes utahensis TaxID=1869 RepID=A0A0A6UMP4_ACTUT|nr:PASTA domain-containing protein [Actinoplanes utahensis]KHD76313.1 hypothetical protein MB27_18080 [Actinoplanes utahensis]GIF30956.1 hypothetical protein Aut01nite_39420 [Actinoplanes utahensis]
MPEDRDPDQPEPVDGSTRPGDPDSTRPDSTQLDSARPDYTPPDSARPDDVWTGRAGVRPYGAVPRDPFEGESDWADPDAAEPSGRWWAPIAVGTVAVTLAGLLVFGITVILQNTGGDTDPPTTTPTAVRITTSPPGAAVTTAPTTTTETVSVAPTTDPVDSEITVPALRGMPVADAQAALTRTGLGWRVIRRESDAEPGTVINCDPAEGQQVPSDTLVTLVVAAARAGEPAPSATVPSAGAPS